MRILITTARFYPEPFTISAIAEGLSQLGNEVTVLTGVPNSGAWRLYDGYKNIYRERYHQIDIIRVKEKVRTRGLFGLVRNYASLYFAFRKELKKLPCTFDIVMSHVMSPIFTMDYVGKYCKKNRIPHFHYGFDLWPESLVATGYSKRWSLLFRWIKRYSARQYRTCDEIAFTSPCVRDYFENYLHVNVPFIHIYQPYLATPPERQLTSGHHYRKDGKLRILFCGTVARFNHLPLLIDALDEERFRRSIVLEIVGSGSALQSVEKRVNKKQLAGTVRFRGRVSSEETKSFYYAADVLFVPLYYNSKTSEMIPQKVIEYLMFERPVFGMLRGDGAALLEAASEDNVLCGQTVEELREGLDRLLAMSTETMERCGKANRDYFDSHPEFGTAEVCKAINDRLEKLVSTSKE